MSIIELGERGYRLADIAKILELEDTDLLQFIRNLGNQGLIQLSAMPKPQRIQDAPRVGLEFMWLEVTAGCNLRCPHCYADAGTAQVADPSAEEIFGWLDQGAAMGCKKVQFTGGECIMRDDLKVLINHARNLRYEFIEVMTNCTLFTEPLVRFFSENSINVATSLYSFRSATHDSITGVSGSFEKTIHGLKLLLAYNIPVRCDIVAMAQNEDDLDGTQRLLKEMGLFHRHPISIRPTGRGIDTKNWSRKYGFRSIRTGPDFRIDRKTYEFSLCWNNCWTGLIAITSNGNVLPCVFAREQIAGNVRSQPLSDIIQGKMQEFWSLTKDRVETCKDCEYRYFCHDCRPWAYGCSGDLYAKSPKCTYDPYIGKWGTAERMLHPPDSS
ncbi:MAG TPA: radical SAM protein [Methanoregulaceae archaeon]|nr:radical SAM protein [Methanoregulaceae archaeon]